MEDSPRSVGNVSFRMERLCREYPVGVVKPKTVKNGSCLVISPKLPISLMMMILLKPKLELIGFAVTVEVRSVD
jgi:hypothetical protein